MRETDGARSRSGDAPRHSPPIPGRGCLVFTYAIAGIVAVFVAFALVVSWLAPELDLFPNAEELGCRDSEVALVRSAALGDVESVEEHLGDGDDPDVVDDAGNSPLACAGPVGAREVVGLLLANGASADTVARDGDSVILDAAIHCQAEVLDLLLDAGVPAGSLTESLQEAVAQADVRSVQLLLSHGAAAENWKQTTVPHERDAKGCIEPSVTERSFVYEMLLDAGAVPDRVLPAAARDGATPAVVAAMALGADANGPSPDALTTDELLISLFGASRGGVVYASPLYDAVKASNVEMSAALLAGGADPDYAWKLHLSSSCTASSPQSSCASVEVLLNHFSKADRALGSTLVVPPLVEAAYMADDELVRVLLDAGADPNITTDDGITALHAAAASGAGDVIDTLIAAGATIDPSDEPTPAQLAAARGHDKLAASEQLNEHIAAPPTEAPVPP